MKKISKRLQNILKESSKEKILLCDLNNLKNYLFLEIYNILFSDNIIKAAFLGNILINTSNELLREKTFYEQNIFKNFTKEIYDLRDFVLIIMPSYFLDYKISKIYKSEKPDFYLEFTNKETIGIECCFLVLHEQYNEIDNKVWKYSIGSRFSEYEYIDSNQLQKFEKHLKYSSKNLIYLFHFGGGARFVCAEISNILEMQNIAIKNKVNLDNIFICIGQSGQHITLQNNWIRLSEIKNTDCCKKLNSF